MSDPDYQYLTDLEVTPRTTVDIMQDVLYFLKEAEWDTHFYSREEREWTEGCAECDSQKRHGHKPTCRVARTIQEAETYLRVERSLEAKRDEILEERLSQALETRDQ